MVDVIDEIKIERERQINEEGWTREHDFHIHYDGQIVRAAVAYLSGMKTYQLPIWLSQQMPTIIKEIWPWEEKGWKPKDRRRNLIRAAALIVAEIERLDLVDKVRNEVTS